MGNILLELAYAILNLRKTRGFHLYYDLRYYTKKSGIGVVFDVGANVGDVAREYAKWFPNASVHCFEPIKGTFEELKSNTRAIPSITCVNSAFGAECGHALAYVNSYNSKVNALVANKDHHGEQSGREKVVVDTVDSYCEANHIERIDVLKIDSEGFELSVLEGGKGMLEKQAIGFVLAETSVTVEWQVNYMDLIKWMEQYDYKPVGIYELEMTNQNPRCINFFNALFAYQGVSL